MIRTRRLSLLVIGTLLSAAAFADDDASSDTEANSSAPPPPSLEKLLEESAYAERWRFKPPIATVPHPADESRPIVDVEFQESSGLARITENHSLTFLNLAGSGKTRLFLGVNEDGLVGLHYRAVSRRDESDSSESDRMPDIRESATDTPEK